MFYVVQGLVESTLIFTLLLAFVPFEGTWYWFPIGSAAVSLGAYGLGVFMASIAIRWLRIGNTIFNFTFYSVVAISGVNIPTESFRAWVQSIADVLPLRHGLLGVRRLLATGWDGVVVSELMIELLVGVIWFGLGMLGFRLFAEGGRRDGTIDLAE